MCASSYFNRNANTQWRAMTVASTVRAVPKPVFAILAFTIVIVIVVLVLGQKYELIDEFSGGEGETKTDSFHLERHGRVRLGRHSYVLVFPTIEVYRVGEDKPLGRIELEEGQVDLDPGDYYILVEAGLGASWTLKVEEVVEE